MGYKLDVLKLLFKRANPAFKKYINKEKIDNQSIKYAQIDNGKPAVVFENGLGMGMKYWDEVFLEIGKTHTVFAYNRKDDKILKNRSMSTGKVELLRKLLLKRGLKPPYVLVGHSLGGLYMQYYAKRYADEVMGLVLVDSTYPDDFENNANLSKKIKKQFKYLAHYTKSFSENLLVLPMTETPVIALIATNERIMVQKEEWKPLVESMITNAKESLSLYPNCKVQMIDTGHVVMYEKPEVVSEAIREILKEIEMK
jgi:pimeloyl-ACP methyl ester carboxylesterase